MKEIEKYFKNPDNVAIKKIQVTDSLEMVTPEIFFQLGETDQERSYILFKHIVCKDGFNMSVQASYGHYCEPRITLFTRNNLFYSSMEVGFPSEKVEELMPYACQDSWKGVYGQVPVDLLEKIIEKHGGINTLLGN